MEHQVGIQKVAGWSPTPPLFCRIEKQGSSVRKGKASDVETHAAVVTPEGQTGNTQTSAWILVNVPERFPPLKLTKHKNPVASSLSVVSAK